VVEDVAFLVSSTPGDHGALAEHVADRAVQCLAAVEDEQDPRRRVQAPVARPAIRPRTTVAFSVEPSTTPSGTLVPSAVTPRAPTMV
jgi:hypothetical protein